MNTFTIAAFVITGILLALLIIVFVFRKKIVINKLIKDAKKGDMEAQFAIAGYYFSQEPKDVENGILWLTKAADAGSPEALTVLGTIYGEGKILPLNQEESIKRFLQGAMLGNVFAQKTIAGVYHFSVGLDRKVAYAWYITAAASGDSHSKAMADRLMNEFMDDDKTTAKNLGLEYIKKYFIIKRK